MVVEGLFLKPFLSCFHVCCPEAVMLLDVVLARVIGEDMPRRDLAHENSVELFLRDVLRTYGFDVACHLFGPVSNMACACLYT